MTRRKRTIGTLYLGILMAGATACGDGGAGPLAPTAVTRPAAPAPGPVSIPGAAALLAVSGTVTEMTANGPVPVKDAYVEVCGYDSALTDERGFYVLTSVPANTPSLYVQKAGYKAQSVVLNLSPDGRLDVRLERE
jgi:hypothetical protein